MIHPNLRREVAERYHRSLPADIRRYLNGRGIANETIDRYLLGWTGRRIAIPIFGRGGEVISFRYGRSPHDQSDSPKMLSEIGACPELYGVEALERAPKTVVICEGEYDRLVLESHGIPAVTSTAGAGVFLAEWVPHFDRVKQIFICFDRDEAGDLGARRVKALLPHAVIVQLPEDVGRHGDVTDFFATLAKTRVDFELLLAAAAAKPEEENRPPKVSPARGWSKAMRRRRENLRREVPIARVLANYLDLRASGGQLVARCPFHEDTTPSFTVYPATNTYYCFGCHKDGDAVSFLIEKESMNLPEALKAVERFRDTNELFGVA
ncbi:MAG: dnaG [Acidobacteria bacterium]|nr:dnaG [Acidobacteriota bacterium]